MRVQLTRISVRRSGSVARRVELLEADPIRIGRGVGNEISLEGLSVSFHHADLVRRPDGVYAVPDPAATLLRQGIRLEGEIRLADGDVLRIGPHELRVAGFDQDGADIALELETATQRGSDFDELRGRARMRIESGLWNRRAGAWFAIGGVLVVCLLFPLVTGWQTSWSTGPISNNHAALADDCGACHRPFRPVQNDLCLNCHRGIGSHVDAHPGFAYLDQLRCASCHLEHGGPEGLAALEDALCASCHIDLGDDHETSLASASDFGGHHPEFTLHLLQPGAENGAGTLRVAWTPDAREESGLSFDHRAHVGGVRLADGSRSNLRCDSCHVLDEGGRRMQPISFEEHCRSCHSLNFVGCRDNPRLCKTQASHAQPGELRRQLRLAFLGEALPREPGETQAEQERRRIRFARPGARRTPEEERLLEKVSQDADGAFGLLMSEESCGLCHALLPEGSDAPTDVAPVAVTRAWLGPTLFDHSSHAATPCARCHPRAAVHDEEYAATSEGFVRAPGTRAGEAPYGLTPLSELRASGLEPSESATDVLVLGRDSCRECHGGALASAPEVASPCVMCHPFHQGDRDPIWDRMVRLSNPSGRDGE